jgi:hypothetical protein
MLVMASSSVLFSAMSLLVPLTRSVDTSIVVSARFVTGIAVILGMAGLGIVRLKAVNRWWLLVRGIIGASSVYFFYRGITTLGLGKGTWRRWWSRKSSHGTCWRRRSCRLSASSLS